MIGQKLLSPLRKLFLEMFFFSIDLLGPKEMFISFAQSLSKQLVDPDKLFRVIFHVRWKEKKEAKVFSSLERLPFFRNICVFNNVLGLKKMLWQVQESLSEQLVGLYNLLPDVCHSRWYEEKRAKNFCHCWNSFYWIVCFYRPFRSQRNVLIICTMVIKTPCRPL